MLQKFMTAIIGGMVTPKKINPLPALLGIGIASGALYVTKPFILWFLIILSVIVFIHEAGHLLAGKMLGVEVRQFSVGFGPIAFTKSFRNIDYRLRVIPLGGFVEFDPESMKATKPWREIIISFAGPAVNLFTPFLALWSLSVYRGNAIRSSAAVSFNIIAGFVNDFFSTLGVLAANSISIFYQVVDSSQQSDLITATQGGAILESNVQSNGEAAYVIVFVILSIALALVNLIPIGPLDGFNILAKSVDILVQPFKQDFSFTETKASQMFVVVGTIYLLTIQAAVVWIEIRQIPLAWAALLGSSIGVLIMLDKMFLKSPEMAEVPV